MKLFYTQNSPYARVARIAIIEAGLKTEVAHVKVVNRDVNSPLLGYNPTCRVPTLVDDDIMLGETRNICAYIDAKTGKYQFFQQGEPDWKSVGLESTIVGFMDGLVTWLSESRRPENTISNQRIDHERRRASRCLDYFEGLIVSNPAAFESWNFANTTLACAFGLMEFNGFVRDWKSKYQNLANWYKIQQNRPSMLDTAPV